MKIREVTGDKQEVEWPERVIVAIWNSKHWICGSVWPIGSSEELDGVSGYLSDAVQKQLNADSDMPSGVNEGQFRYFEIEL